MASNVANWGNWQCRLPLNCKFGMPQVDKTVIETFVQGGRMTANMRSYPTLAYGSNAHMYFFNNGSLPINVRSIDVWQMQSANLVTV